MERVIGRIKELVDDIKIGVRFYRLGRRYSLRNRENTSNTLLKDIDIYEEV